MSPSMDTVELFKTLLPERVGPNLIAGGQTLLSLLLAQKPFDMYLGRAMIAAGLDPHIDLGNGIRPIAMCATKEAMIFMVDEAHADFWSPTGNSSSIAAILVKATPDAARELFLRPITMSPQFASLFALESIFTDLVDVWRRTLSPGKADAIFKLLTDPEIAQCRSWDLVNAKDKAGNNLLQLAMELRCSAPTIEDIHALGVDVNHKNNDGESLVDNLLKYPYGYLIQESIAPLIQDVPVTALAKICQSASWGLLPKLIECADADDLRRRLCEKEWHSSSNSCLSGLFQSRRGKEINLIFQKVKWLPADLAGAKIIMEHLPVASASVDIAILKLGLPFTAIDLYKLFEARRSHPDFPQILAAVDFRHLIDHPISSFQDKDYTHLTVLISDYSNDFLGVLKHLDDSGYDPAVVKRAMSYSAPLNAPVRQIMTYAVYYQRNPTILEHAITHAAAYIAMHRKYFGVDETESLLQHILNAPGQEYAKFLEEASARSLSADFDWKGLVKDYVPR
jgi:hypothetical protein